MSITIENFEHDAALYTVDDLPESDGKPMAETHKHVLQMVAALNALRWHFRDDQQLYLIGNMFVYFLDNLGTLRRVAPDIFAVRGISTEARRVYAVEKEGKAPDIVIEFTSKKTQKTDTIKKPKFYSWLGVKEYFMFDPLGEYLKPRLIGNELVNGEYARMKMAHGRLHSKVLGLDLVVDGDDLRFYDPQTEKWLLRHEEAQVARQIAEAQAQRELAARQAAEAEVQRELAARQAAEAEISRLREELARLQKG
jgi:Uma2 family endonuclease